MAISASSFIVLRIGNAGCNGPVICGEFEKESQISTPSFLITAEIQRLVGLISLDGHASAVSLFGG